MVTYLLLELEQVMSDLMRVRWKKLVIE